LIEGTQIVRRLLAGESVTFQGREFQVRGASLNRDAVSTPLLWGVMGPRLVQFAGRHADGVALNYAATADRVHAVIASATAAAKEAGRDPGTLRFPAHVFAFCDADEAVAVERFRALLEAIPSLRHEAGLPEGPVRMEDARERAACGSGPVIRARLDEYLAAGATELILCAPDGVIAAADTVLDGAPG
jgi:alkanesulfonate monooxygenase SsuD/methylene tetrahydromethanopterin reductase-like flavin-dependent oxidoreductase (luciferase family)